MSSNRSVRTDRRSAAEAVSVLTVWIAIVGAALWTFDQMTPIAFYCLSYLGLLLIAQWTLSKHPGTRLKRATILTVALASAWFLLAIATRILELLPEISSYF